MSKVPPFQLREGPLYAWKQVADHVEALIRAGELAANARLPGERALAEEYGVAIGTIRRAVQDLRERGIVTTLPSKGTFVTGE